MTKPQTPHVNPETTAALENCNLTDEDGHRFLPSGGEFQLPEGSRDHRGPVSVTAGHAALKGFDGDPTPDY